MAKQTRTARELPRRDDPEEIARLKRRIQDLEREIAVKEKILKSFGAARASRRS